MKPMLKKILLLTATAPLMLTAFMAFASPMPAIAANVTAPNNGLTFATFADSTNNDYFTFKNIISNNTATFGAVNDPVNFFFSNAGLGGLNASLTGNQAAHLTMTSSTSTAEQNIVAIGYDAQPLDSTMTIKITRDVPIIGLSNLLTAVITTKTLPTTLLGINNGFSASFNASGNTQNITYTSDFLNFASINPAYSSMSLSFSALSTALTSPSDYLADFGANGVGTFSTTPAALVTSHVFPVSAVPEPSSYAMMFLGLGFITFKARRKSSKKTDV
ncbi:PEP-CTERM sorting domain-containing protein [Glaciimonas sp. CA11.2]|nr:PEP-CTERM sorting domain-containing protein [Glaciimonas sp. CA11.2]MDY7547870.1 PEP-CTERM sorting domain-containing protein [Glaciimonas sp. CA11.2]MEB0165316.1 PEP-CTERM sorting domain-containing protein [Glaciimonas sp. CA11.2]